jgi:hypothetical protein
MPSHDIVLLLAGLAGASLYLLLLLVLSCKRKPSTDEQELKFRLAQGSDGLGLVWASQTMKPTFGRVFGNNTLERKLAGGQFAFTHEELNSFALYKPALLAGDYIETYNHATNVSTYHVPLHDGGKRTYMAMRLQAYARGRATRNKAKARAASPTMLTEATEKAQIHDAQTASGECEPQASSQMRPEHESSPANSNRSIFDALLGVPDTKVNWGAQPKAA